MDKEIQLFLLPYAGGSTLSFMKMIRFLDRRIEAITIEYSGRGSRKNEPIIEDYQVFLSDVVNQIKKRRKEDLGFSILGYSMGSAISFDICSRKLVVERPLHAFFCAEGSLIADNQARKYAQLSDDEFKEKVLQLGGLDARILSNQSALNSYLNLIKADHNILGQYAYENGKVACDSTVIYSPDDMTCVDMQDWEKLVSGAIDFFQLGNNHFFLNQEYEKMAYIINDELF